jgi:hypothetical protein
MKLVRVKYIPPLAPLIQDLQRIFPNNGVTAQNLDAWGGMISDASKKRYVYVKEFRNALGVRTHVIAYSLVRDSFMIPAWIQGEALSDIDLNNPIDHHFMGHENRVLDNPNEEPETPIL